MQNLHLALLSHCKSAEGFLHCQTTESSKSNTTVIMYNKQIMSWSSKVFVTNWLVISLLTVQQCIKLDIINSSCAANSVSVMTTFKQTLKTGLQY